MITARPVPDAVRVLADLAGSSEIDDPAAVDALRERHPACTFDLVHDAESFDGSVHRDLIIRAPGSPTVSVSVAAADGLPWPLRGVVRAHDRDLVDVGGTRIEVAEAMAGLDLLVRDRSVMQTVIDGALIKSELQREPVAVADADLQRAVDAFRRAKRLFTREQTEEWLTDRGLTPGTLGQLVRRQAELDGFRRRVVSDAAAKAWYDEHATELDQLTLGWAEPTSDLAEHRERFAQDPLSGILAAAASGRRSGIVQQRADSLRSAASPHGPLGAPAVGQVVDLWLDGPVTAVVLHRRPEPWTTATKALVAERLFADWLSERRRTARVTWFWGEQEQTR